MSEELIDSYIDRAGIDADTDYLEEKIKGVFKLAGEVKDKIKDVGGATSPKGASKASEEGIKANARMEASLKAIINLINQRFAAEAKLATLGSDYAKQTAKDRQEINEKNKALKTTAELEAASFGSIDRAKARLKQMRAERDALNLSTQEGRERQLELNTAIDKYDKFIKKNTDNLTAQKINIGNYRGAVVTLKTSLEEIIRKMDEQAKSGKQNTAAMQALKKEYDLLNNIVNSQAAGFANARAEMAANKKALYELEQAGLAGSEAYEKLAQATGDLKNSLDDINARTKALGSDTFAFDSLIQGAQTLAGVYGAAQGAAALFGEENEELQKTMVKLQAIMTVITSLQAIQNGIQKESAFMLGVQQVRTKAVLALEVIRNFVMKGQIATNAQVIAGEVARGAATTATATATRGATAAAIGLRAALLATGIGAILLLISAAASAMSSFGDATDDTNESLDAFGNRIDRINDKLADAKTAIDNQTAIQVDYAKMKGASDKEIADIEIGGINRTVAASREAATEKIQQAARLANANKTTFNRVIQDAATAQQAINSLNDTLIKGVAGNGDKLADKQKEGIKAVVDYLTQARDLFKEANQGEVDAASKARAVQVAEAEKAREKAKAAADKAADERRKRIEEYAKAEAAAQREILRLGFEDRKNLARAALDNDKLTYDQRITALAEFQKASQALIDFENNLVKNDPKKTKGEKQLAENKAIIATRDLQLDGQKQYQDLVDKNFEKRKGQQAEEIDSIRRREEQRRQIEKDILENKVGQEELALRNKAEQDLVGKNAAQRLKIEEKLQEDLTALRNKAALVALQLEEAELLRKRELLRIFGLSTAEIDKLITQNEIAQSEIRTKNTQNEVKKKEEILKEGLDMFNLIQQEATDVLSSILAGKNTKEKNRIQDEIDAIEIKKNAEIEAINASALTEEQKAARIANVQAVAQAKKEEAEQKQRRLDLQRAKFERDLGILQIIIQIGIALAKQQYQAAALAGASLIKALATPLPRFFMGKNAGNKYEGPALINDGGKIEPHFRADTGTVEISNVMNKITHVGKDDIIYTSIDDMLKKIGTPRPAVKGSRPAEGDVIRAELKKQNALLLRIADKKELVLEAKQGGMVALWKHGANTVTYINEQTNWG